MIRITIEQMPPVKNEEQKRHLIRYVNFINSRPERKNKNKKWFFEKHHIIPKSLGGSNEKQNLIVLTIREHFIAHMILFHCGYSEMIFAYHYMICGKKHNFTLTCKQFERVKIENSLKIVERWKTNGHPLRGRKQSRESIEKGAAKRRGFKRSDESKKKMSVARKNRITTDETRKKMSESHKGKTFKWSDEAKAYLSKIKKGCLENTVWYNNGVENIRLNQDDKVPNGFCKGKLQSGYKQGKKLTEEHKKKLGKSSEGKSWYTNGVENIRLLPNKEIPIGFFKGKTHNKEKKKGITDGFKNKFIPVSKEIPEGWFLGSTQNQESRKGKVIHITNGEIQKTVNIDYVIPDGWYRGRPEKYTNKSNSGKFWITNNLDNKMINETEEIPEGWIKGRTMQRSKTN